MAKGGEKEFSKRVWIEFVWAKRVEREFYLSVNGV